MIETRRPPSRSPRARLALIAASLAGSLFLAGRAEAGVTLVMQRGDDAPSTLYIDGDKMRMENAGAKERTVIVDAAHKRMLMVNEPEKTYSEITEADMKRLGEMMAARRAQMEERLKSMPPEQRKLIEGKMGPMLAGKDTKPHVLKFERTGAKKTINGFSCDMYRVTDDGAPKEEDCLAPWSASLLQRSDFTGLRKFAEEMAKDSGAMSAGGSHQMFEQFEKYPGFPVSRHPLEAGEQKDEQLKSLKRGSIPAEKFGVPAGFTKTESPMSGALGGPKAGPFKPAPRQNP